MFERNRVDNATSTGHQTAVPAELTLTDGEVLCGHFLISSARAIADQYSSADLLTDDTRKSLNPGAQKILQSFQTVNPRLMCRT